MEFNGSIPSLDPNWVTGFTDAEGCFSINLSVRKDGRREIAPGKNFFKLDVSLSKRTKLDRRSRYTKKQADYILWKNIVSLQKAQEHLTMEGFHKCLSFKANLNKGLTTPPNKSSLVEKSNTSKTGYQVQATFYISQHSRDLEL
ncbi:hypothetical protein HK099_002069 [Clydaea vesicula]|uniref:LAGLIDADG homing endonuclease n=1 Tax=Clydaea vesicula TaxID=447962 RepID=A0AAD5Y0Z3_9FUNG|nr:hypothetical protein HK099_002069 [Clydaea vesicula]